MSKLPLRPLPTAELDVGGAKLTIRGVSRSEAVLFGTRFTEEAMPGTTAGERVDAAETWLLALAADVDEAEAAAWRQGTDMTTVGDVLDKILELSGLQTKDGKDPQA